MNCDYKGCKEWAISACMIVDVSGEVYHRDFCKKHLKKMLWNEKNVILEE